MTQDEGYRRKLIEVQMPLVEISIASLNEKKKKVGTLKNFHKWFAPMPTPALRALIFASLVDDPGDEAERGKLVQLVKELVPLDGTVPSDAVLERAAERIAADNPELPTVFDPFAGGGSTIVEALRLGLPAMSSDLNPVAALITRALGELLPPLAAVPAVSGNRGAAMEGEHFRKPYEGIAEDLRYYGNLVQERVKAKVGDIYPEIPEGKPVAWLWARSVPCPNPACGSRVPLYSSPWLSKQPGREVSVEPAVEGEEIRIVLHRGTDGPAVATKGAGRAMFVCPRCSHNIGEKSIRAAGMSGQLGLQLMAVCIDDKNGRKFLDSHVVCDPGVVVRLPEDIDEIAVGSNTRDFRTSLYGLNLHVELYTSRQLAVLATFADEVAEIEKEIGIDGGNEDRARAITTILAICVSKLAQSNSSLVRWRTRIGPSKPEPAFGTQSMPMLWDFAESYPFGHSVGSWKAQIDSVIGLLGSLPRNSVGGRVFQIDARKAGTLLRPRSALIVTDPPYFGQINYADLSDYFYLWLRRALKGVHADLFETIATPKVSELTANPARHGGDGDAARQYFINGFTEVFSSLQEASRPDLPIVVAYAAKQDDKALSGGISTAWESMLEAALAANLAVVGTLPVEATHSSRQVSQGANALSSYIILVCRPRKTVYVADKNAFLMRLRGEMPEKIELLRKGGVAPLDMGQAAIGPGMEIFSSYSEVLEPDGGKMTVHDALVEIDKAATSVIDGEETEYDPATRFCLKWFRQHGFKAGAYGDADVVLRQTGSAIRDLEASGVLRNPGNAVQLLGLDKLAAKYDPRTDPKISHWEVALQLAKCKKEQGDKDAAWLMAAARKRGDINLDRVNRLVHRLFKLAEQHDQPTAVAFNQLGTSWSDIVAASREVVIESEPAPPDTIDFSGLGGMS